MQLNNIKNNHNSGNEKIKLSHFIGVGLLAFGYILERAEYKFRDFIENTKDRIKLRLRLQKELIVNPKEIKEKTFNLKYYNQKITTKVVDKFLLLNEESVNSELIKEIMIYSLHNQYKDNEVIAKAFCIPDFEIKDMLDNYAFISIKNPDIAMQLLKNEQFITKVQENEVAHELLLKPLRRQSNTVVKQILNDEDILKITIDNPKKVLKGFLNQLDTEVPEDIVKEIQEKNIFSNELIKEECLERINMKNLLVEMGKSSDYKTSDIWLKNQMSRIEYERYDQKYPQKNTKTKLKKI